ncbi:response regulator transcription factor [Allorhizobium sp. BGMRC 0089]|uniref:response regulator n=1 Tax=Allorhizobium sonneratiae TaxID=2934936 RepID=UPI00203370A9|nr:response regulator transcription factor [Allorhizobium sonneratiae]MCM2293194.1 response regulator transcription factor [Allorhizobium sonneratiae]
MRILLIEDDHILGEAIRDHVASEGHAVDWMQSLQDGEACTQTVKYGLILLDLRLPDGNGIHFLKRLRSRENPVPVIILTAHDQLSDRIEGLNSGADDYLVKPFDLTELTARMAAVARRYAAKPNPVLKIGDLEINQAEKRIVDETGSILLSSREWAVLDTLIARPGAVVSKSQIEEALYAFGSEIESNTVEVYISRLRKKIGKERLITVRGVGYSIGQA